MSVIQTFGCRNWIGLPGTEEWSYSIPIRITWPWAVPREKGYGTRSRFTLSFSRYVRSRYAGAYWHALPKEVAQFMRGSRTNPPPSQRAAQISIHRPSAARPKIWIDLDNTPHVPFFQPVLDELRARGFPLLVTARNAFQVCDLADKKGLSYIRIGRHYGKNRLMKGAGLAFRALQLAPLVLREKPRLAVSHGARSQLLLCNWLRLPSVLIEDYEYSQFPRMMRPTWLLAPEVIPDSSLCVNDNHLRKYPGIKEDVYAWKLKPEAWPLRELSVGESDLVVTVRPPATEAHYHNPESERLLRGVHGTSLPEPSSQGGLAASQQKAG